MHKINEMYFYELNFIFLLISFNNVLLHILGCAFSLFIIITFILKITVKCKKMYTTPIPIKHKVIIKDNNLNSLIQNN